MLGDQHGLDFADQFRNLAQMFGIQRVSGADGQADAVQTQGIICADAPKGLALRPTRCEVVFAVRLEPSDGRALPNDLLVMLGAQPDPGARRRWAPRDPLSVSRGEGLRNG